PDHTYEEFFIAGYDGRPDPNGSTVFPREERERGRWRIDGDLVRLVAENGKSRKLRISDDAGILWLREGPTTFSQQKEPNQSLEPTPTSATPPAAQESRRP